MKVYYGTTFNEDCSFRQIYATVTGQMSDGTLVYTEIEQTEDRAIVKDEYGDPKLILGNQYTRRLKRGMQTFERI